MLARLRMLWVTVRDSLWFVPTLLTLAAAGLAVLLVHIERSGLIVIEDSEHWLLGGGAEGARGVLSAIAAGLITVTGVVFSVTIVALQLASSQFTPRVLRNFTADRSNQIVLGVFIGTFTYTLLVLRVVRSPLPGEEGFIPRLAVGFAVFLVLVSIGFLIYFINHAARSMQISIILHRVAKQALQQVERLFPGTIGHPDEEELPAPELPRERGFAVPAEEAGYLQAVDGDALFQLGESKRLIIRMEHPIGTFILPGQALATVWPAEAVDEEVIRMIRRGLVLGPERTPEQDVEFGIIEMSDIAVKALSPGINDPTTAFHCIDRLSEVLAALGNRKPPPPVRTEEGRVHFIACHTSYERAVGLAFDQIHHFGKDNPAIVNKLRHAATSLAALVPEVRRAPLHALIDELEAGAAVPVRQARSGRAVSGSEGQPRVLGKEGGRGVEGRRSGARSPIQ